MGRKIVLTESELVNLIKRIVNEQLSIGGVSAAEMVTSASDLGLQIGVDTGDARLNICEEEYKDYEKVAKSFNWCRLNSKADKYSWPENWAANQVKKDVQTTSTKDLIIPALETIKTAKDFCQFVNSYYKFKGDLYNDIDKHVSMFDKWVKIFKAIPNDFKVKAGNEIHCKKSKTA
jgi:hypothetical protein